MARQAYNAQSTQLGASGVGGLAHNRLQANGVGVRRMNGGRERGDIDWRMLMCEAEARWGITRLRPGQREVIELVLRGRSAVAIMPTSHGKSLCFQLPALVLPRPVIVVSPLLALMQDQQSQAADAAIEVAKLDSTLSREVERDTVADIRRGALQLVYVTPERLENPEYLELLRQGGVSLLVVDEAHCIAQWGHDFRPAYLALRHARRVLGDPPVLALTATATPDVAQEIAAQLGVESAAVIGAGIERPNIFFAVQRTVNGAAKRAAVLDMLRQQSGSGIIYVATVRAAEELCRWLRANDCAAERYHGQLRNGEREAVHAAFMSGEQRIMVATKAFGLGINKPDIRFVIHYHLTDSPESYYQEAGRAGRDGEPACALLLFRLEDRRIQTYFLGGRHPRREQAEQLYAALRRAGGGDDGRLTIGELAAAAGCSQRRAKVIAAQLEAAGMVERRAGRFRADPRFEDRAAFAACLEGFEARTAADRARLAAMMEYGQMAGCRVRFLRGYFGEPEGEDCGHCDNCRQPHAPRRRRPARRRRATLAIGDAVSHAQHGAGVILGIDGADAAVRFLLGDTRTLPLAHLRADGAAAQTAGA